MSKNYKDFAEMKKKPSRSSSPDILLVAADSYVRLPVIGAISRAQKTMFN
jgi:hypothetical protein